MDEERFERLVEAYGGEAARWPDADRAPALRYLAANPGAHTTRAAARRLDQLLDAWPPGEPSAALRGHIAAGQPSPRLVGSRTLWLSGAGLAAACAIGVMVGAGLGQSSLGSTHDSDGDPAVAAVDAALDGAPATVPALDGGWG
jgi:hypothetical protein